MKDILENIDIPNDSITLIMGDPRKKLVGHVLLEKFVVIRKFDAGTEPKLEHNPDTVISVISGLDATTQ